MASITEEDMKTGGLGVRIARTKQGPGSNYSTTTNTTNVSSNGAYSNAHNHQYEATISGPVTNGQHKEKHGGNGHHNSVRKRWSQLKLGRKESKRKLGKEGGGGKSETSNRSEMSLVETTEEEDEGDSWKR